MIDELTAFVTVNSCHEDLGQDKDVIGSLMSTNNACVARITELHNESANLMQLEVRAGKRHLYLPTAHPVDVTYLHVKLILFFVCFFLLLFL